MFLKIRLPDDVAYGARIEFESDVTRLSDCSEHQNVISQCPKNYYILEYDTLNAIMIQQLMEFFRMTQGRVHSFLFRDWLNFEARKQSVMQLPVASTHLEDDGKIFQLSVIHRTKNFDADLNEDIFTIRKVTKPIRGSLKIVNSNLQLLVENDDYQCDYDTGVLTFKNKLTDDCRADFDFDIHVRFDTDFFEYKSVKCGNYAVREMRLVEIN